MIRNKFDLICISIELHSILSYYNPIHIKTKIFPKNYDAKRTRSFSVKGEGLASRSFSLFQRPAVPIVQYVVSAPETV